MPAPIDELRRLLTEQSAPSSGGARAIDGDTFHGPEGKIRVKGVNTPELGYGEAPAPQKGGEAAKEALRRILADGHTVDKTGEQTYGRDVGVVRDARGQDAADTLIREGLGEPTGFSTPEQAALDVGALINPDAHQTPEFDDLRAQRDNDPVVFGDPSRVSLRAKPKMSKKGWKGRAIDRGIDNLQATGGAFLEASGIITGLDRLEEYGREVRERNQKEASLSPADIKSYKEVDGALSGLKFIAETVLEQAPQVGLDLAAGLATGGTATLLSAGARTGLRMGVGKVVGTGFKQGMSRGVTAAMFPQMMGESYSTMVNNGVAPEEAALASVATGAANTALEKIGFDKLLNSIKFGDAGAVTSVKDVLQEVGKAAGISSLTEGSTELAQNIINEVASMALNSEHEMSAEDLAEAFFRGMAAGGGMATIGRASTASLEALANRANNDIPPSGDATLREGEPEDIAPATGTRIDEINPEAGTVTRDGQVVEVGEQKGTPTFLPEPAKDLRAQVADLLNPENARKAVIANPTNVASVIEAIESEGAGDKVDAVRTPDGNVAFALKGEMPQTGSNAANAAALQLPENLDDVDPETGRVVQAITPEGAVRKEAAVSEENIEGTVEQFQEEFPDSAVEVKTAAEVQARRAAEIEAERTEPEGPASFFAEDGKTLRPREEIVADIAKGRLSLDDLKNALSAKGVDPEKVGVQGKVAIDRFQLARQLQTAGVYPAGILPGGREPSAYEVAMSSMTDQELIALAHENKIDPPLLPELRRGLAASEIRHRAKNNPVAVQHLQALGLADSDGKVLEVETMLGYADEKSKRPFFSDDTLRQGLWAVGLHRTGKHDKSVAPEKTQTLGGLVRSLEVRSPQERRAPAKKESAPDPKAAAQKRARKLKWALDRKAAPELLDEAPDALERAQSVASKLFKIGNRSAETLDDLDGLKHPIKASAISKERLSNAELKATAESLGVPYSSVAYNRGQLIRDVQKMVKQKLYDARDLPADLPLAPEQKERMLRAAEPARRASLDIAVLTALASRLGVDAAPAISEAREKARRAFGAAEFGEALDNDQTDADFAKLLDGILDTKNELVLAERKAHVDKVLRAVQSNMDRDGVTADNLYARTQEAVGVELGDGGYDSTMVGDRNILPDEEYHREKQRAALTMSLVLVKSDGSLEQVGKITKDKGSSVATAINDATRLDKANLLYAEQLRPNKRGMMAVNALALTKLGGEYAARTSNYYERMLASFEAGFQLAIDNAELLGVQLNNSDKNDLLVIAEREDGTPVTLGEAREGAVNSPDVASTFQGPDYETALQEVADVEEALTIAWENATADDSLSPKIKERLDLWFWNVLNYGDGSVEGARSEDVSRERAYAADKKEIDKTARRYAAGSAKLQSRLIQARANLRAARDEYRDDIKPLLDETQEALAPYGGEMDYFRSLEQEGPPESDASVRQAFADEPALMREAQVLMETGLSEGAAMQQALANRLASEFDWRTEDAAPRRKKSADPRLTTEQLFEKALSVATDDNHKKRLQAALDHLRAAPAIALANAETVARKLAARDPLGVRKETAPSTREKQESARKGRLRAAAKARHAERSPIFVSATGSRALDKAVNGLIAATQEVMGLRVPLVVTTRSKLRTATVDRATKLRLMKAFRGKGPEAAAYVGTKDGYGVIVLPDVGSLPKRLVTFAHELGHAFIETHIDTLSGEERHSLMTLYKAETGRKDFASFREWAADQFAHWAVGNRGLTPAVSAEGGTFMRLLERLARIWAYLKETLGSEYSASFGQYLDGIKARRAAGDTRRTAAPRAKEGDVLHLGGGDNTRRVLRGVKAQAGRAWKSKTFGAVYRMVYTRLDDIDTKLRQLFYQESNSKVSTGKIAWQQRVYFLEKRWKGNIETAFRGYDKATLQAGMARLRQGDLTDPVAKKIRNLIDNMNKEMQALVPSYHPRPDLIVEAFSHEQVAARRDEFDKIIEKHFQGDLSADERRRFTDSILTSDGITDTTVSPGKAVSQHEHVDRLFANKAFSADVAKAGFLLNEPNAILHHWAQSAARRIAWEENFGGYVAPKPTQDPDRLRLKLLARAHVDVSKIKSVKAAKEKAEAMGLEKDGQFYSPNAVFREHINRIAAEKGVEAARLAEKLVRNAMGFDGSNLSDGMRNAQNWLLTWLNYTILSFSGVASIPEIAGGSIRGAGRVGFGDVVAVLREFQDNKAFAIDRGIVASDMTEIAVLESMGPEYQSPLQHKAHYWLFKLNGQQAVMRTARTMAVGLGRRYLLRTAQAAQAGEARALDELQQLNVTAEQVMAWQRDGQSSQHIHVEQALSQFVHESVVEPSRFEATSWGNNPYMKLAWHLKQFFFSYSNVILMGVWRAMGGRWDSARGEGRGTISTAAYAMVPGIVAAAFLLPLAMGAQELRELIQRRDRSKGMEAGEYAGLVSSKMGLFGPFEMIANMKQAAEWGRSPLMSLAPVASKMEQLIDLGQDGRLSAREAESKLRSVVPFFSQNSAAWDAIFH